MKRFSLFFLLLGAVILSLAGGTEIPVNAWNPIFLPEPKEVTPDLPDLWDESLSGLDSQALFEEGLARYDEGKYYSARCAFHMSGLPEAEELAAQCVQDWPETAEIWRGDRAMISNAAGDELRLKFEVTPEADTAVLIRVSRIDGKGDPEPVSMLFFGGKDSVTIPLSEGTFIVETERGSEWYGTEEAFGDNGSYEIMTFDYKGTTEISLKGGLIYTITAGWVETVPEPEQRDFF